MLLIFVFVAQAAVCASHEGVLPCTCPAALLVISANGQNQETFSPRDLCCRSTSDKLSEASSAFGPHLRPNAAAIPSLHCPPAVGNIVQAALSSGEGKERPMPFSNLDLAQLPDSVKLNLGGFYA